MQSEKTECFLLRPEVEKAYRYSHHFPTVTWPKVKGLVLPEFLI